MSEQDKPKNPRTMKGKSIYRIPEERKAAARVLYESTPGITQQQVADEIGVSRRSVENWCIEEGWNKVHLMPPTNMTEAAQQVADRYTGKLAEYGDDISAEQKQVALKETAVETAVDLRAQLLDRHRREWQPIRNRVYKQLDPRSSMSEKERFEASKTTKINAETLAILQLGERKAWGIDKPGEDAGQQNVTVVIERS